MNLSERADLTFAVRRSVAGRRFGAECKKQTTANKQRKPCTRYTVVGTLKRENLPSGFNRLAFLGRIGGKKLRTGSYIMVAQPTDMAGNRGRPRTTTFRIARPSAKT